MTEKPTTLLTKADTVALWYACTWMEHVLHHWRKDIEPGDEEERAKWVAERAQLTQAKRALRKVNAIRKGQR